MTRLLVVTAVAAERDAILAASPGPIDVLVAGVGPAAAAAATAQALAVAQFDAVLCAGIGGGFAPVAVGDVVAADRVVFADLGAETAEGFVPASRLGFGGDEVVPDRELLEILTDRAGARAGTILTVATVTGTARTADERHARYPGAVAEGMEGAGVAAAAGRCGVRFGEVRAISNPVGPRNRDAWQMTRALDALGRAVAAVASAVTSSGS